ncbi:hypothetical protein ENTCAN_07586 [Enterobacter cancerogenus ATCC 35316]|nr:hypothetical protein ENTCAN_07586 [Enterobacter cancerogenus ATCC 35316]
MFRAFYRHVLLPTAMIVKTLATIEKYLIITFKIYLSLQSFLQLTPFSY